MVRRLWSSFASLAAILAAAAIPAVAEGDPTRDVDACQADVHRLCEDFFPDEKRVATCLVDKRASLSVGCAEVLARPPSDVEDVAPSR